MALVFLFLYAPIIILIIFSFNAGNSSTVWKGFSLQWYEEMFNSRLIMDSVYVTLLVSLLSTVISTIAGTFAAVGFYNLRRRVREPLMTVSNIPMMNADIVTAVSLCLLLLILPLSWGYATLFLRNLRGEPVGVENLFDGYRSFSRIFTTYLLQCIYVMLWSLLLIVPGIVKALSYAMTPFVLLDEPTLSRNAAIERSMAMMQGYKAKLFVLYLSFIGWGLLCILTCGIGTLWLYPYMYTAQAAFYEDVRRDYEQRQLTAQD